MKSLNGEAFLAQLNTSHFTSLINGKTGYTTGAIIAIGAMNVKTFGFCPARMRTMENGSSTNSS